MLRKHRLTALLLALTCATGSWAQDGRAISAVEQALSRVERALQNEPGLATETKDALSALMNALREERATVPQVSPPPAETPAASQAEAPGEGIGIDDLPLRDRLEFFGDIRLRSESKFGLDTDPTRHRQRVRLRFGAKVDIAEDWVAGLRLVTGDPEDPTTTNQTLDNSLDKFEVSLDRIYVTYTPGSIPNAWFTAGKFGAPWVKTPVFGDLAWDGDAQPQGLAMGYAFKDVGPFNEIKLVGVQLIIEESASTSAGAPTEDAFGSIFQVSGDLDLTDTVNLQAGATYYSWSDLGIDGSLAFLVPDNFGNVLVDLDGDGKGDVFQSDFGTIHPFAVLRLSGFRQPIALSAEYLKNVRANNSLDQGYAIGASIGEAKKKGSWQLFYQWQVLEQDAVLSAFNSDDNLFHTGFHGHVFGMKYQLTDRIQFKPHAYVDARERVDPSKGQDGGYQWKTRLDLNVKF